MKHTIITIRLISLTLLVLFQMVAIHSQVYIRTNLVGYRPQDTKTAVAFSDEIISGNFTVVDQTGRIIATLPVKPAAAPGYGPFKHYYELDYSGISQIGKYDIRLDQYPEVKKEFLIQATGIYSTLPDVLLQFMRQQRCGYNPFLMQSVTRLMAGSWMALCRTRLI